MGKLACRCGYTYHGVAESGCWILSTDDVELLVSDDRSDVDSARGRARSIYECPNCGALALAEPDGVHYRYYVPQDELPRVYVDRSVRDALGGFALDGPRSRSDIADQRVLLRAANLVMAYDDTGWSCECSIEVWLNPDDTYDEGRMVARAVDTS